MPEDDLRGVGGCRERGEQGLDVVSLGCGFQVIEQCQGCFERCPGLVRLPDGALCVAEVPQCLGLPEQVALGQVDPVCLGQAGDRLVEAAGFQVDAAEVLQCMSVSVSSADGCQDAERLLEVLGCLVCLAEIPAVLAVVVQACREQVRDSPALRSRSRLRSE